MSNYVDFSRIQETSDGDTEFEIELIEMYLEDASSHVQTIFEMLEGQDPDTLKQALHTLKGSSANIGAIGIQKMSGDLEKEVMLRTLVPAKAKESLTHCLEQTTEEFQNYLTQLKNA